MAQDKPAIPEWAVPGTDVILLDGGRGYGEPTKAVISRVTKASVFAKRGDKEWRFTPERSELVEYGHSGSWRYSRLKLVQVGSAPHVRALNAWAAAKMDRNARQAAEAFARYRTLENASALQTALSEWVDHTTKAARDAEQA